MDQQIIHNPTVPAAPLLPSNDPQPSAHPMAAYYGGRDPFADATHAAEDPAALARAKAALVETVPHVSIGDYPPDMVQLPIPVVIEARTYTTAYVRELTGADEEELGRAGASGEPERILDTLLQCGLVSIGGRGDHTPNAADVLDLAVPNRDALILGIRRATYGNEIKFERLGCTHCDEIMEVTYDLDDVPATIELSPEYAKAMPVSLRRGGTAYVRFPNGADQMEILSEIRTRKITRAEQDTLLLSRVLVNLVDANGMHLGVNGVETARALSIPDRTAILKALDEHRPGPRLDEAVITCTGCQQETEVPLSVETLFRG